MNIGNEIIKYYLDLNKDWKIPKQYGLLNPFQSEETVSVFKQFYSKYFNDDETRIGLFGINPGRFGAGVTAIAFTDPKILAEQCGIENTFQKRNELSAIFIYEMIAAFGSIEAFYSKFFISSVCPLGFVKDGINYNYYDAKDLQEAVETEIIAHLKHHLKIGISSKVCLCLGQGKNFKYFQKLNEQHRFFEKIIPLPHPRWVMQYRRKTKEIYLDQYVIALNDSLIKS